MYRFAVLAGGSAKSDRDLRDGAAMCARGMLSHVHELCMVGNSSPSCAVRQATNAANASKISLALGDGTTIPTQSVAGRRAPVTGVEEGAAYLVVVGESWPGL